ncbi:receptor-like serine/threonine-protein kinase ALE2 [Olea europaea var. sylvestris]|uniref:receptor-like serine/threonine-protein kinase ALE2 n=1 Tax=Olea europaea var. sylvestris TaxID=158386 RepID=UPI000C1D2D32|nr:receptor-like serine/threonine-protein kinase ALE2 [Olea europaea var. sylvestris]
MWFPTSIVGQCYVYISVYTQSYIPQSPIEGYMWGLGSMQSSSPASSTSASLVSAMPASVLSVKTFRLTELEKATDKFSSKRILGEGGFGRVYLGIMEDATKVAVKLLTRDNQNGDREFIAEVEMLSRLHHRNLVKLIGICIEERTRCLVYEIDRAFLDVGGGGGEAGDGMEELG